MLSTVPYQVPTDLLERADHRHPVRMAVVGATDWISMESARRSTALSLIEPLLIGPSRRIHALAEEMEWDIGEHRVVDAGNEQEAAEMGATLAREGTVTALMKGHVHTDCLMRAVLKREAGLRTERRISHAFHMTVPDRQGSLVITDAAVNVAPGVDELMDILGNVVGMMHALGNDKPHIAVLSATEHAMASMPSSIVAAEVNRRAREEIADAVIEGPLAFDNAMSAEAAAIKGIDSPVAGAADVLLVPNIETGNALFKAMVYLLSATAAGVVLGAKVPIVLTSRADPPEARLASAALAAVVSSHVPS